jgi:hypothetical protein
MTMTTSDIEARLSVLEEEVAELRRQLERTQIATAMRKSIQQFERGEGIPAVEAVKALGRKYGLNKP